ncbi:hypothetical protein GTZ85_00340 [Streptomyces sp. SID5474]|nr:hypothetical protein [Streptomyces sp. SID5474]
MNFTWFASSYDTDDVAYRLLTMVQMAGVLVLAAGVPATAADSDYRLITTGYLVMRVALVAQWLRAAAEHPAGRRTALRYAAGIALLEAGWILRLVLAEADALPSPAQLPSFGDTATTASSRGSLPSAPAWRSRSSRPERRRGRAARDLLRRGRPARRLRRAAAADPHSRPGRARHPSPRGAVRRGGRPAPAAGRAVHRGGRRHRRARDHRCPDGCHHLPRRGPTPLNAPAVPAPQVPTCCLTCTDGLFGTHGPEQAPYSGTGAGRAGGGCGVMAQPPSPSVTSLKTVSAKAQVSSVAPPLFDSWLTSTLMSWASHAVPDVSRT